VNKEYKIMVITEGDANKASTWSNVPYFLTKTLEEKQYKVYKVDISINKIIPAIFSKFIKLFLRNTSYSSNRTRLYTKLAEQKMKRAINKYPDVDFIIVTNFSYSPYKYTNKPIILFSDWTYEYYIKYFQNRLPDYFEKKEIKRQNTQIENSTCIITLFPQVCEYMKRYYNNNNIYYLGNVVNTIEKIDSKIINEKEKSNKVLFIGNKKYIMAAKELIEAVRMINNKNIELHIIGLKNEELNCYDKNIYCYGYLNKSIQKEKELYNNLLENAKVCVNTSEKWAGFSSIVECMYYYTPIITTPYIEFIQTFGENIEFGYYCKENKAEIIKEKIEEIFKQESYKEMCIKAHESVKDFSWDNYVEKMIKKVID